jgi:hypothetical protein
MGDQPGYGGEGWFLQGGVAGGGVNSYDRSVARQFALTSIRPAAVARPTASKSPRLSW